MPQFAVFIYAADATQSPTAKPEDLADADRHVAELMASGKMRVAYALAPRASAVSVTGRGVAQGTFHDPLEVVAGFYVLEAADLDEAVNIAGQNPATRCGGGVEVRAVHSGGVLVVE